MPLNNRKMDQEIQKDDEIDLLALLLKIWEGRRTILKYFIKNPLRFFIPLKSELDGAIRFSFSKDNTEKEIDEVVKRLKESVERIRKMR